MIRPAIRVGSWLAILVISLWLGAAPALALKRVALVIGNTNYAAVPHLPNPVNDATAFAEMLRAAGFDSVELRTDVTLGDFKQALRDFTARADASDIAVFYFAGHGLEVGGNNLLVPVDAHLKSDLDAEDETVTVDRVLHAMEPARSLRLLVLDACRENPFVPSMKRVGASRGVSRGLQRIDAPADTMIAFATEPGSVADDGNGGNSPFTTALVNNVAKPGVDLRIALGHVRDEVLASTGGRQRPFVTGSLGGATASLVPASEVAQPSTGAPAPEAKVAIKEAPEADFNTAQTANTAAAWQAFLRLHPRGTLAARARDKIAMLTPAPRGNADRVSDSPPAAPPADLGQAPTPRVAAAPDYAYCVAGLDPYGDNFLALRAGPSSAAPMIRQLGPGTRLAVGERSGKWLRVATLAGEQGWVAGQYVAPATSLPAEAPRSGASYSFVTNLDPQGDNWLALKSAPMIGSQQLRRMGPGTRLSILGRRGIWLEVQLLDGSTGWASARYIGCCVAR